REWCEYKKTDWSEANAQTTLKRLEKDVFPAIGSVPIKMITHKMLLDLAQNIKARGANELAKRVIQMSKHIFQYAIITGRADKNIGQDLVGIVKSEPKGHFASIDSKDIPQFDVGNDFVQKAQRTTYFKKLAPVLLFNLAVAGPAIAHYEEKLLDENGFDSSHMTFYRK
ncbi:MAG: hypothetical protein JKY11_07745, partial [Alphaproteobacteria bacterium]|nr:hypothetical protein [Alphaproteobacteria bacterium]